MKSLSCFTPAFAAHDAPWPAPLEDREDAHRLAGTIAANVRIGRSDATDAEVDAALRAAGLGAWLDRLPAGADTLMGEDGVAVSGGQRQGIGLAARSSAAPAS